VVFRTRWEVNHARPLRIGSPAHLEHVIEIVALGETDTERHAADVDVVRVVASLQLANVDPEVACEDLA